MAPTPRRQSRTFVRVISAVCALFFVYVYSTMKQPSLHFTNTGDPRLDSEASSFVLEDSNLQTGGPHSWVTAGISSRHLLGNSSLGDDDSDNCTDPRHPPSQYRDSCSFVRHQCQSEKQLIDYLGFVLCPMKQVQPLAYIILAIWLVYLISLLATTADYFFVPPLNLLAEKLKLSPSIAGITLLAIGNGAPDVFTAFAALKNHDHGNEMALVLGALIGASIFISTIVLGTIILISKVTAETIDKLDLMRDILAYICVVALVVGVAIDGKVHLYEAVTFPIFYFIYIAIVVAISYLRTWYNKKRKGRSFDETTSLLGNDAINSPEREIVKEIAESMDDGTNRGKRRLVLRGLTWPRGSHIGVKIQWLLEWPVSFLRWLSIPPCNDDGNWTEYHHWFAVTSPIPMAMILLIAAKGWDGFTELYLGKLPLYGFLAIIGFVLSLALFFLLKANKPPHWSLQVFLGVMAFIMSIAWLNIEANEVVTLLEALGLLLSVDTAILGLTVLAIGNSVGDWVADTAVARAGKPGMGVASCFGSPLLNDVLGLSVALIARIGFYDHGKTYTFPINDPDFSKVKLSWVFLGISLVMSAVVIPLFKFSPPRAYGVVLIYIYIVFMVFSVLDEVDVLRIKL